LLNESLFASCRSLPAERVVGQEGTKAVSADNHTAQDEVIRKLAAEIRSRGLAAPTVLFLECYRPFSYLGGQFLYLVQPLLSSLVDSTVVDRLAELLDDGEAVDRLIRCLEAGP